MLCLVCTLNCWLALEASWLHTFLIPEPRSLFEIHDLAFAPTVWRVGPPWCKAFSSFTLKVPLVDCRCCLQQFADPHLQVVAATLRNMRQLLNSVCVLVAAEKTYVMICKDFFVVKWNRSLKAKVVFLCAFKPICILNTWIQPWCWWFSYNLCLCGTWELKIGAYNMSFQPYLMTL